MFSVDLSLLAPDDLRPYLIGVKLADDIRWRHVGSAGCIDDHRRAYDRGETAARAPDEKLGARVDALTPHAKKVLSMLTAAALAGRLCPTNDEMRVELGHLTVGQDLATVAFMTVVSIARGYIVRRVFERFRRVGAA